MFEHFRLADSFAGLPPPDLARYPVDRGITLHEFPQLAISLERVQDNFDVTDYWTSKCDFSRDGFATRCRSRRSIGLQCFVWMVISYESTIQALEALYDKLSAGGYVIVDDYGNVAACGQAVHDFRAQRGSTIRSSRSIGHAFTGGEHNLPSRNGIKASLTSAAIAESCRLRRGLAVYGG